MLISVVQDFSIQGIFVKSRGMFNINHIGRMIQNISGLPIYADGVRILHDVRDVEFDISMDEVLRVVHARRQKMRMRRLALLHDKELGFGMCRAMASLIDLKARRTEAFREIMPALLWLYECRRMYALPSEIERLHEQHMGESHGDDSQFQMFMDISHTRDEIQARPAVHAWENIQDLVNPA